MPVLSPVMGPPDHCCFAGSLRVRSPLMAVHDCPPSVVRKSTLAPWYTTAGSCGDVAMGAVHWNRYFMSAAPWPDPFSG